ncbi:hypothetical protein Nepgr_010617 [Nepenthes gracilis]|uniref:2-phosphoglycerate kinase n=1 Tax=Nepenthes gracilis TaxID=150966 RepID=A0AAD3SDS1_NEPGR|nr:hypothetical protein Nepgr_010617 [Nepenthes gracilis]
MKEKGVLLKKSNNSEEEKAENPTSRPRGFSTRNASSKYDFVKVKVWLGDNADHYYVLSRFLLCRMLTVTKIPYHVAIKIALELKKLLVDNSLLDVSQSDLEANLFKLMERRGYGEEYINRYKMITRFHHQRVPLVILVCGTACSGKSTIATQLAQRLNLPNVLQTDMVYELLRTSTDAPLASTPVWEREFLSSEELITEFCRECRIVRKGLAGDLKKAMKDGKPIIIEGIHLDPSIYLDGDNKLANNLSEKAEEEKHPSDNSPGQMENKTVKTCETSSGNSRLCPENVSSQDAVISDQINEVVNCLESVKMEETVSEGGTHKIPKTDKIPPVKKERCGAEPIIVPIVLNMAEFDHEALLEEWIATRTYKDKDKLISNLKTIQDYLCKFQSQGLTIVNISPTTFPQTLDWLHSYLLQCIEQVKCRCRVSDVARAKWRCCKLFRKHCR